MPGTGPLFGRADELEAPLFVSSLQPSPRPGAGGPGWGRGQQPSGVSTTRGVTLRRGTSIPTPCRPL
jgi:hypothetical protein